MSFKNKTIRALAGATVALLGVGGLAGRSAHAAGGCAWPNDCITSVGADVYADDLSVGFWTNVQTTAHFVVWDYLGHEVPGTNMYDGAAYHHSFTVTDKLVPGAYYVYQVDATDAYGKTYTEKYGVTTRNRIVTFTIDKIYVSNDSDAFSAGDLYLGYRMGSYVNKLVSHTETSVSSGSTWYFKATQTVQHAAQNFWVAVEIQDIDGSYANCGYGTAASWDSGSSPCYDWATAGKTFTIPSMVGSGDSGTVSFSVGAKVGFTVYGHYHWQVI